MKNRRGISLIEVLVAVVLLGLIATVHTGVTLQFSVRNRIAASGVNRTAAMSSAVDLYSTMPYTSLAGNTGCTTLTVPAMYPHQRCVTVSALSAYVARIQIIIDPTNSAFRSDTTWIDRAAPPGAALFQ
jgi:prepilin-type N-terminal cleavage/methylation domain-containing protein